MGQRRMWDCRPVEVAHVDPKQVTSRAVAFMLAPRINACGRLDDINKVVDLLLCDDYERAYALAQELDS